MNNALCPTVKIEHLLVHKLVRNTQQVVLNNINLSVYPGQVIGFIAAAHVHQQPKILWWGISTLFLFYAGSLLQGWQGSIGFKESH
ncbi:hypothetical protein [Cellvibrio sp. pealriver]|uniref:hypothetical protein n=1 Tax=Cellvibrio sp. pealriver TaxID=1622269 RepID=UPI00066FECB0|nr:hypothetical protein [Cellvibrio sp. pealriver]